MSAIKSPAFLALIYGLAAAAAVVVALVVNGHVSGFDCSDSSWADSVTLVERDRIYQDLGDGFRLWMYAIAALGLGPLAATVLLSGAKRSERVVALVFIAGTWMVLGAAVSVSNWAYSCI